jgi:hypothetical protein
LIAAMPFTQCSVSLFVRHKRRAKGSEFGEVRQGRALHSSGAARIVQRADLMGTSWREQDVPNPVENAIPSVIN